MLSQRLTPEEEKIIRETPKGDGKAKFNLKSLIVFVVIFVLMVIFMNYCVRFAAKWIQEGEIEIENTIEAEDELSSLLF
ncbi:MAG: hypothetical protein LUF90_07745 [Rikenellaceae bacterium]|nr:hypothetical protein [Rikenellaceae bacterium]